MKRANLFPVLMLILASLACGALPKQAEGPVEAQEEPTILLPTSEISGVGPSEPTPVVVIEDKSTVKEAYDPFDAATDDWSLPFFVTTKALPGREKSAVELKNGNMTFSLMDEETYLYEFYESMTPEDVLVETKYQAGGNHTVNGVALICRAASDLSAWYEFRLGSDTKYSIFRYDVSRRDEGKNPYILLAKGGSQAISPSKENIVRILCKGSDLVLEVNGQQVSSVQDGTLTGEGLVGVGAMSYNLTPTYMMFDYFSYTQP
ncbi:hypothetical protein ADN00_16830 [Ornatilinea apprima]|uniref:3-keto-disaccharide hydrolase domain-containing protein n=1 Tax=Ornatilinea apprima TaxID=1134406 RepID=A0A0N8GL32_9CHLR|nr:hypothetical protein [Ornatilinea apprima]KPL71370.1 hypothetical protein ADN00_16830 [Ornatilinea apprima]